MKRPISLWFLVVSFLLASSLVTTMVVADEPQSKAPAAAVARQASPRRTERCAEGMMTGGMAMMSSPMMSGTGMMAGCPAVDVGP
jgi:hypothetical protein